VPDPGVDGLLRRKYGWQKRILDFLNRRTPRQPSTVLEISLQPHTTPH
jgi:hypothetical protein